MRRAIPGLLLLLACVGAACTPLGGPTPPSRFYLLQPLEGPPQRSDGPPLGIGPVRLADYLDRPQMVRRRGDHALQLAEFDRWAEPLGESITRVLLADLAAVVGTDRIQRHPWRDPRNVEVQLDLDVQRFDGPAEGPVELVAAWRLRRGPRVVERISRITEPQQGSDYAAQAAAMSRALQRLAREIGQAVPAAP